MKKKHKETYKDTIEKWRVQSAAKKSITLLCNSLTGKLMFLFLAIILPVNILMVIITGLVRDSYEKRIKESYNYQLEIYSKTAENQFESMEKKMKDFLTVDNLVILMQGSKTDSMMDLIRFNNFISESDVWSVYPGMYYVWDKSKDIIVFSNMYNQYSVDVRDSLEEQLRQIDSDKGSRTEWSSKRVMITDGQAFLLQQYDYPFFSIGIFYDVEGVLKNFYAEGSERIGDVYLSDAKDILYAGIIDDQFQCDILEKNSSQRIGKKTLVVSHKLGFGEYTLVHSTQQSKYMKNLQVLLNVLYILCGICFIAIPLLWIFTKRLVINPIKTLCIGMEEVEAGNLEYQIEGETGSYQMNFLYYTFNNMIQKLHRMVVENYEREIEKLQTDSINMRLQVNQHMLLNFLNTVYSLSRVGKKEEAEEFTLLLMNYFRYVLRKNIGLVTIREEMQFVQDYLKIQKIRFPESFHLVYSIEEGIEEFLIPQLLIENFVENTIKYGLIMGQEIEILINIRTQDKYIILSICDTGNGMPKERAEKLERGEIVEDSTGKHIGVWNCKRRLKYYYGDEHRMAITSTPGQGTQVWIQILKEQLEQDDAAIKIHQMENLQKDIGKLL